MDDHILYLVAKLAVKGPSPVYAVCRPGAVKMDTGIELCWIDNNNNSVFCFPDEDTRVMEVEYESMPERGSK